MRKLGKGQSVLFCVNEEIEDKIRARVAKPQQASLEVVDVLAWSISETFKETQRAIPLWAVQGERFLAQSQHWKAIRTAGEANMSKAHSDPLLEAEAQTLDDRYRPRGAVNVVARMGQSTVPRMDEIRHRCSQFKNLQFNSSSLQEEQERELSPEIEQERQVERPSRARPAKHDLHADVLLFVSTGTPKQNSAAYMPAFGALRDTTAATNFKLSQLDGDRQLLATADFARTIEKSGGSSYASDSYQRPVQWILASKARQSAPPYLMVISPFEAEQLISVVDASSNAALHLYKPRCVIGYRTFDKLDFMSIPARATTQHIPRSLLLQLDIFAGQLYLNTFEDYLQVCDLLGLATKVPQGGEVVAADGFIVKDGRGLRSGSSPVHFLQGLMSKIRRNGQGIAKTDMGYILEGKILERTRFVVRGETVN